MTINDSPLTEELVKIHRQAGSLDYLTREGREMDLFRALMQIESAAHAAQQRLNALKYK